MPWKSKSKVEQRFDLVRQMAAGKLAVSELCRRFKISRQTAYKWFRRYRQKRLSGLKERSRRPCYLAAQTTARWLRRRRPTWGARKLRHTLRARFGKKGAPSTATINRWLQRWGLSRGRRRRARGPVIQRGPIQKPRRVEPLTVRALKSRYGLAIGLLRTQALGPVRKVFQRLFGRHGPPRRIRCDNGTPFGGGGPTGLTRLSAWWVKQGIEVEFITPGRPGENGAHEQFHRV
jgi:transposase